MNILLNTEKQSGLAQLGGWHDMARRRYQKGSIRKRGKRNPVWELQWWADYLKPDRTIGRKRESKILGNCRELNLRQAQKLADEVLGPINTGKSSPFSAMLFAEFVETHFVPNAFPALKPSTRKRYRITLNHHLLPAFGKSRLSDIGTLDIQRFVIQKMNANLGWESCDHLRRLMSKIFATAKKWGFWNGDNPAAGIELPEKRAVHEKHALNPQQISELLPSLSEPMRLMVRLAILTGLRVGELLALRYQDVDFEKREIHVERAWYRGSMGSPKTKGSRRTLHLPEAFINAYRHLETASTQGPGELIFRTRSGHPYSDTNLLHRFLKPAGKKIGAPWLSWHTFRRTHATLLQSAGGSLKDAQAQLGHSKLSTTLEVYTIPLPAHQREAVEKLSRLVTNGDELGQNAEGLPLLTEQIQ